MKIARGYHSVGQHLLQYEDKCFLMRRWHVGMIRIIWPLAIRVMVSKCCAERSKAWWILFALGSKDVVVFSPVDDVDLDTLPYLSLWFSLLPCIVFASWCFWFCFISRKIEVGSCKALMTLSIMLNTLQVVWQRCTYVVAHFLHTLSCLCGNGYPRCYESVKSFFQQQLLLLYWMAWIDHNGIWRKHAHWVCSRAQGSTFYFRHVGLISMLPSPLPANVEYLP